MTNESFRSSQPEAPPDIRQFLLKGKYQEALDATGEKAVREEIGDMTYSDLANYALRAAVALKFEDLAKIAAEVIKNSGGYDDESNRLAATYLKK